MRSFLLLLLIALLLTLSCSQGTNPIGPVPNASLFFDLGGPTLYVINGGQGTAYEVQLWRFYGNGGLDRFAQPDSLVSQERYGFSVSYDSLEADWKNPNGTTGRVRAKKP
jgi:hypothetical protein